MLDDPGRMSRGDCDELLQHWRIRQQEGKEAFKFCKVQGSGKLKSTVVGSEYPLPGTRPELPNVLGVAQKSRKQPQTRYSTLDSDDGISSESKGESGDVEREKITANGISDSNEDTNGILAAEQNKRTKVQDFIGIDGRLPTPTDSENRSRASSVLTNGAVSQTGTTMREDGGDKGINRRSATTQLRPKPKPKHAGNTSRNLVPSKYSVENDTSGEHVCADLPTDNAVIADGIFMSAKETPTALAGVDPRPAVSMAIKTNKNATLKIPINHTGLKEKITGTTGIEKANAVGTAIHAQVLPSVPSQKTKAREIDS